MYACVPRTDAMQWCGVNSFVMLNAFLYCGFQALLGQVKRAIKRYLNWDVRAQICSSG